MSRDHLSSTIVGCADSVEKALREERQHHEDALPLEKIGSRASAGRPTALHKASSCAANHDRSRSSNHISLQPSHPNGDTQRSVALAINDEESQGPMDGTELRTRYEVTWDGEADPENPRTMSKARKWLIVMITSTSSTCVYEALIFFPFFLFLENTREHERLSNFEQDLCFVHVYLNLFPAHTRVPLFTDSRYAWLEPFCGGTGPGPNGVSGPADSFSS